MATPSDVAAYRKQQAEVAELAHAELVGWWASLGSTSLDALKKALETFLPELVRMFGDIAATVAADWYASLRDDAGASGAFIAVLGDVVTPEQAQATARWAAGAKTDAEALSRLAGSVQRYVQQGGRNTLARNVQLDPAKPRWARAPQADSCSWCRILASRGAVYFTEKSAGGDDNDWHDDCNCQPVPVWADQREPYDVDGLLQQYKDAFGEADSGDIRDVAAKMREQLGIR